MFHSVLSIYQGHTWLCKLSPICVVRYVMAPVHIVCHCHCITPSKSSSLDQMYWVGSGATFFTKRIQQSEEQLVNKSGFFRVFPDFPQLNCFPQEWLPPSLCVPGPRARFDGRAGWYELTLGLGPARGRNLTQRSPWSMAALRWSEPWAQRLRILSVAIQGGGNCGKTTMPK